MTSTEVPSTTFQDNIVKAAVKAKAVSVAASVPETEYTVLRTLADPRGGVPRSWELVGTITARSSSQAIRKVAEARHKDEPDTASGTYVAVPARSWQPVEIKAKVEQVVRFEGL